MPKKKKKLSLPPDHIKRDGKIFSLFDITRVKSSALRAKRKAKKEKRWKRVRVVKYGTKWGVYGSTR